MTKGLTGIKEEARGLIGRLPKFDETVKGKARVRFELGCGVNEPANLKFATWRHCVAYGETAEMIRSVAVGSLVLVRGWVTTEAITDDYSKPVIKDGVVQKREYLICFNAQILEYDKIQSQLPLGVQG